MPVSVSIKDDGAEVPEAKLSEEADCPVFMLPVSHPLTKSIITAVTAAAAAIKPVRRKRGFAPFARRALLPAVLTFVRECCGALVRGCPAPP